MDQTLGIRARSLLMALAAAGVFFALPEAARGQRVDSQAAIKQWDGLNDEGKNTEAETLARSWVRFAKARRDEGAESEWRRMVGHSLRSQRKFPEAEEEYRAALELNIKLYGADDAAVSVDYLSFGWLDSDRGRYADAEQYFKRALKIRERVSGPRDRENGYILAALVELYIDRVSRPADSLPLLRRLIDIDTAAEGAEGRSVARDLNFLARAYRNLNKDAEAEAPYKRALAIEEKIFGPEHNLTLDTLNQVGTLVWALGRQDEAETIFRRLLQVREKVSGPTSVAAAVCMMDLADLLQARGKRDETDALRNRAFAALKQVEGPDRVHLARVLEDFALRYLTQNNFAASQTYLRESLAIREKYYNAEHPLVATTLVELGALCDRMDRRAEAEPLLKRGLAIREKVLGADDFLVASAARLLGEMYKHEGRYAESEALLRRCVEIHRKAHGPDHVDVASAMNDLIRLLEIEHHDEEAMALKKRCLAILEKALPPDHPDLVAYRNYLAKPGGTSNGSPDEVLAQLRAALAKLEAAKPPNEFEIAGTVRAIAIALTQKHEWAEAAKNYKRSLAIAQRLYGRDHTEIAADLSNISICFAYLNKWAEGEPLADRAVAMFDRLGASAEVRSAAYRHRAWFAWNAGRRTEALADMEKAIDLSEMARGQSSGTAVERAAYFSGFSGLYDEMVEYQCLAKDPAGAIRTIERAHARSLLEEFSVGGTDLDLGRSAEERDRLKVREGELTAAIASLEKRIADGDKDPGLAGELASARDRLYDHSREARASSPIYQSLISAAGGPPRLSTIQRQLLDNGATIYVYYIGANRSFVIVAGGKLAVTYDLNLDEPTAKALGVAKGPLTAEKLQAILINPEKTGVVQMLANPVKSREATPKLAALWNLLIPAGGRKAMIGGLTRRLIVVPDGPLALLPFEALVVETGEEPKYLLDVGPPITYSPSASVLMNLQERPHLRTNREPLLTVGDPVYSQEEPPVVVASGGSEAKTRYGAAGGRLVRLPFTAQEVQWIVKGAEENKVKAVSMLRGDATESAVRRSMPGRKYVHLACHGLTDPAHGNFFGSLAFTPGPKAATNSEDDGFLTLREIYRLDLRACEIAVLSACETNFGPQQKGEGVWAVSRGFLVAGAHRVVASNWLVDDEAAASLISLFLTEATKPITVPPPANAPKGTAPRLATRMASFCLRDARRWVRKQEKWKAPYYWASLVQIGPP
jgi:CHAT domain-containing protein/tetratricopeptide (TPR) repeat protein